jgi:hypothetical protein
MEQSIIFPEAPFGIRRHRRRLSNARDGMIVYVVIAIERHAIARSIVGNELDIEIIGVFSRREDAEFCANSRLNYHTMIYEAVLNPARFSHHFARSASGSLRNERDGPSYIS